MFAILSSSIENASKLSSNLQDYWNTHGVYQSIALYETVPEFLAAMEVHPYSAVILECVENPIPIITKINTLHKDCKIAIIIDNDTVSKESDIAISCHRMGVNAVLTHEDFQKPLAMLSKQLQVVE